MVNLLVVCPDEALRIQIRAVLAESQQVSVRREIRELATPQQLVDVAEASAPDLVLVSIRGDLTTAEPALAALSRELPKLPVVTFGESATPELLLRLMRVGVRDHLVAPFSGGEIGRLLHRLRQRDALKARPSTPPGQLFAFLPAKAGAGASTIALNVAVALAKVPDQRTLLMDADLASGVTRFLLNLDVSHTLTTAVELAVALDEESWPDLVAQFGDLDVLPSATDLGAQTLDPQNTGLLCTFAKLRYRSICADLSGVIEPFATEILQSAKRILLVTTSELPSLYLASQKILALQDLELSSRVQVILNRVPAGERELCDKQIEQIVGAPVSFTIDDDPAAVHESVKAGREVKSSSALGRQFAILARQLAHGPSSGDAVRSLHSGWALLPSPR